MDDGTRGRNSVAIKKIMQCSVVLRGRSVPVPGWMSPSDEKQKQNKTKSVAEQDANRADEVGNPLQIRNVSSAR